MFRSDAGVQTPRKLTTETFVQTEEIEEPKPKSPSPPPFDWKIELKETDEETKKKIDEMSKEELR